MLLSALVVLSCVVGISNGNEKTKSRKDFYAALVDMGPLVEMEHRLTKPFLELVKAEEDKLNELEFLVTKIEKAIPNEEESLRHITNFLGNPINSMRLIHRLTDFWPNFMAKTANKTSTIELQRKLKKLLSLYQKDFPEEDDVKGAISSLFNLQDTYKISPQTFSDGLGPRAHRLILEEIFELGYIALGQGDYWHAQSWLRECYERFHPDAEQIGFLDKASLIEYLAWSEYKIGNLEEAISLTEKVLEIKPDSSSANTNIQFFEEDYAKMQADPNFQKSKRKLHPEWLQHQNMCNEEDKMDPELRKKLFCRYEAPDPVFILKPLKVEDSFLDPDIKTFHEFLSDYEIEYLKKLTRKKLYRATVHDPLTGKLTYAQYRISKSAWIKEEEDVLVAQLYKRVQALSGLDMMFTEPLQVVNYGIGGHYTAHYDYATNNKSTVLLKGWRNRIATALIYMSDVHLGGNTVFIGAGPGATTKPRKGDLIFWYNLKKSGKGDSTTKHAACPVLIGNKWVANFWIHEYGQEFRRRCGLKEDE